MAELPGILNWLVEGYNLWKEEGLIPPPAVLDAVKQYRDDEDLLSDFINEHVRPSPGTDTSKGEMFECYQDWAEREGIRYRLSSRGLRRRLIDRGSIEGRIAGGGRVWRGVALEK